KERILRGLATSRQVGSVPALAVSQPFRVSSSASPGSIASFSAHSNAQPVQRSESGAAGSLQENTMGLLEAAWDLTASRDSGGRRSAWPSRMGSWSAAWEHRVLSSP